MSEQASAVAPVPSSSKGAPATDAQHNFLIHTLWKFSLAIVIVMVLLALLGVGLTTTNSNLARTYWIALVPVYGLACVITAWRRAGVGRHFDSHAVARQVFHWLGIAVALALDFFIRGSGTETGIATGLTALLLLALGCYLAGVHLDVLFVLVGVLLTLVLVVVTKADEYLWLIFVVGALAVAALVAVWWLIDRQTRKRRLTQALPTGS